MATIRPDELAEKMAADSPYLLDLRPEAAFRDSHIDGSVNIPVYHALAAGETDAIRSRLDSIPTDQEIVTICKQGIVAKRATKVLQDEGYDATTLLGGMSGWRGYQRTSLGYRLRSIVWRLS